LFQEPAGLDHVALHRAIHRFQPVFHDLDLVEQERTLGQQQTDSALLRKWGHVGDRSDFLVLRQQLSAAISEFPLDFVWPRVGVSSLGRVLLKGDQGVQELCSAGGSFCDHGTREYFDWSF